MAAFGTKNGHSALRKIYKFFRRNSIYGSQKHSRGLKNIVQINVNGNCCVKIFKKTRFRGANHQLLLPGSENAPNFGKIKSFKFLDCNLKKTEK